MVAASRALRRTLVAAAATLLLASTGGAQDLPPRPEAAAPGVLNPSFEGRGKESELPAGWYAEVGARNGDGEDRSTAVRDTEVFHTGKASLRLSGGAGTDIWTAVVQDVGPVEPGMRGVLGA